MHGTLPGNSLAPIAHPRGSSLKVGSRVVGAKLFTECLVNPLIYS